MMIECLNAFPVHFNPLRSLTPHLPDPDDKGNFKGFLEKTIDDFFGFDVSVNLIKEAIAEKGPFDGVLAFSQGAGWPGRVFRVSLP